LVLGLAALAVADPGPALSAKRTALSYPDSTRLISVVTTPSVIMKRLAGSSEWTTFAAVPSGDATTVVSVPTSTAGYEVVSDGVPSTPVTITVAALLTQPRIKAKGLKGVALRISGDVAPRIDGGTVNLRFSRWQRVSTTIVVIKYGWVLRERVLGVALKRLDSQWSKWSYKWTPHTAGTWRVVVAHQDTGHAYSSSAGARVIVKS
jgi:hypothetical protein